MTMTRRALVAVGTAFGGAVMMAATTAATPQQDPAPRPPEVGEARGKVALFGERSNTYFALSEMPAGIETFSVDPRIGDRAGRLLLDAARESWTVEVTYARFANGSAGPVYDVRVAFPGHKKGD
jgi:hypothetical protein